MSQEFMVSFHFERREIEAMDTERFEQVLSAEEMPPHMLRHYAGAVHFRLLGYHGEDREAFAIPEIRRYLGALDVKTNGALAFLSELEYSFMLVLGACRLKHLTILQAKQWRHTGVHYDRGELDASLAIGSRAIRRLGERGGLSRTAIDRRENRFLHYFRENLH
jgi:hypothetical protein